MNSHDALAYIWFTEIESPPEPDYLVVGPELMRATDDPPEAFRWRAAVERKLKQVARASESGVPADPSITLPKDP